MFVKIFTTLMIPVLLVGCGKDVEVHRYTEIRDFPDPAPPAGPAPGSPQLPPARGMAGPLTVEPIPANLPPDHPTLTGSGMPGSMQGRESEGPPPPSAGDVVWTTPDGWEEQVGSGMRIASFRPQGAGDKALVTLIALGPGAGGLEANVTRWRRQVGLPEEHVHDHVQVQGQLPYTLVNLVAESAASDLPQSTIGAIYSIPGRSLFLKFTGDTQVLIEGKAGFLALANSIGLRTSSEEGGE
jgi:hypothetical protein